MSGWQPPSALPDLRRAGIIALDTETNDEGLRADRGSAWPWRGGYICGVSIAYRDESGIRSSYFPLRHPDSKNFDRENVACWLKDLLASGVRIVTQNGLYDYGWLRAEFDLRMPPSERLEEILALATLIDEKRFAYGLDALCAWRGLPGKDTTLLREAVKTAGWAGRKRTPNIAEYIFRLPAHLVGPYAEADPIATLALYENLNPILDREGTRDAYRLEIDLLPMVHEMRRRGIRIHQGAAEQARDLNPTEAKQRAHRALPKARHSDQHGRNRQSNLEGKDFDRHSIKYPRTKKGNPSFKAGKMGWMAVHPHWLPQLVATASKYERAATTFLEDHILGHLINGRIYSDIHPHRGDDGSGACSFRFSYSDPPLQQMPSRDKELGPLIRACFLPEDGEVWAKPDISQQEFRLVVHYAALRKLPLAKEAAELYRTDPNADFHAMAKDMTGLEREAAKAVELCQDLRGWS